jgi:hypothetical protein
VADVHLFDDKKVQTVYVLAQHVLEDQADQTDQIKANKTTN